MTRILILIICCNIFIEGCKNHNKQQTLSQEEYDIYSSILDTIFVHTVILEFKESLSPIKIYHTTIEGHLYNSSNVFLISTNPKYYYFYDSLSKKPYGVLKYFSRSQDWDIMINNFKKIQNDTIVLDSNRFKLEKRIQKVYSFIDTSAGYPNPRNGVNSFSRVGFNTAKDEAIVYFRQNFGDYTEENTLLLRKQGSKWKLINGVSNFNGIN